MVIDENLSNADSITQGSLIHRKRSMTHKSFDTTSRFSNPDNPGTLKYHTSQHPVTMDGPLEYLWLIIYQATMRDDGGYDLRIEIAIRAQQWVRLLPEL